LPNRVIIFMGLRWHLGVSCSFAHVRSSINYLVM